MTNEHNSHSKPTSERSWNSYLQTIGSNAAQFTATALQRIGRTAVLVGGYSAVIEGQFDNVWDSLDGRVVTTSTSLYTDIHAGGKLSASVDNIGNEEISGNFDATYQVTGTFGQEILLDLPKTNLVQPSTALVGAGAILWSAGLALEKFTQKKDEPVSPGAEIQETIESAESKAYYYGIAKHGLNLVADFAGMYAVSNIAFNNSVRKTENTLSDTFVIPSVQPFEKEREFALKLDGPDYTGEISGRANLRGSIYAETNIDVTDIKNGLLEGIDRNGVYLLASYGAVGLAMLCQYGANKLHNQEKYYTKAAEELKTRQRMEDALLPKDIEEGSIHTAQSSHTQLSQLSISSVTRQTIEEDLLTENSHTTPIIPPEPNYSRERRSQSDPVHPTNFADNVKNDRLKRSQSFER